MFDVKTTVNKHAALKAEMLVTHTDGSIGLVVNVTRKWVHVVWLINTKPVDPKCTSEGYPRSCPSKHVYLDKGEGLHHFVGQHMRKELTPCPSGTVVTLKAILAP